jgi:hypothetical protein|tara:strand:- start:37857 stop:38393 length:537 start_codon:yes stop_codon:yes gene_type:complete
MPKIIGICGSIGSGKTLVADYLCASHNFFKIKMASPIKDMLSAVGLTDRELEGTSKELGIDLLCGHSPRYAMQTLGTEWGRNMIGKDIWVNLWRNKAYNHLDMNCNVVADDVRFPNEVEVIKSMGGKIIKLHRSSSSKSAHKSEELKFDADIDVDNNDSVYGLYSKVDSIIQDYDVIL